MMNDNIGLRKGQGSSFIQGLSYGRPARLCSCTSTRFCSLAVKLCHGYGISMMKVRGAEFPFRRKREISRASLFPRTAKEQELKNIPFILTIECVS
jgi:hypothetical protein